MDLRGVRIHAAFDLRGVRSPRRWAERTLAGIASERERRDGSQGADGGVDRGALSRADADAALDDLDGTTDLESAVSGVDLVIEAIPEELDAKRDLLAEVEEYVAEEPFYPILMSPYGYEDVFGYAGELAGRLDARSASAGD